MVIYGDHGIALGSYGVLVCFRIKREGLVRFGRN